MAFDFQRAKAIFLAAVDRTTPTERDSFLQEACGEDGELRVEIEALLRWHAEAGSFLESPPPGMDATRESAPPILHALVGRPSVAEAEMVGAQIGPYRLLQRLGEGGMGIVWVADQEQPVKRRVAIKVIKPGMDSALVIRRFEAERQALAVMDHPHIAKVLDAGSTSAGRPYFVMEFVKGIPITTYCDELHLSVRERLELLLPVCHAIQHAHQKGIIHRDIKPSNVLVAMQDGNPSPKVIDFGVAKALNQKLTDQTLYTELGAVIGTLEYMSPEQAELQPLDIDTRADLYALGVLLYELLTGTTPLDRQRLRARAYLDTLRVIREEEPPKPSTRLTDSKELLAEVAALRRTQPERLTREVRGDLDWIVMRCLEKDRTRRYASANGLARDLERHLNGEPVEACPPTVTYRLGKFLRRHRLFVLTAAAFVAVLVVGSAISIWQAYRATIAEIEAEQNATAAIQEREANKRLAAEREVQRVAAVDARVEADAARSEAEQRSRELRRNLYMTEMNLAGQAAQSPTGIGQVAGLVENWRRSEPGLRGWEWYYLNGLCHRNHLTLHGHAGTVRGVAWSPDGQRVVSASYDGTLKVWDASTGESLMTLVGHSNAVRGVAWSPDGQRIASASMDRTVKIWDAITGRAVLTLQNHTAHVSSVAWSRDGTQLASGGFDGTVRIWDAASGREVFTFAEHQGEVLALAWSPDGTQLASGSEEPQVKIWNVATGQVRWTLGRHTGGAQALSWSPDGTRLASTSFDIPIKVWDMSTGQQVLKMVGHSQVAFGVQWSPDGTRLASASEDQTVRIWNAADGTPIRVLRGHTHRVNSVAWSADGHYLVSSGADHTVRIWDANADQKFLALPTLGVSALSPNGTQLATARGRITILDVASGHKTADLAGHGSHLVACLAWSPDGSRLASGGADGRVTVWDMAAKKPIVSLTGDAGKIYCLAWSPDGTRIASGSLIGVLNVWNVETGRELFACQGHVGLMTSVGWSPDGSRIATANKDQTVRIWNAATGEDLHKLTGDDIINSVAWSRDGTRLAAASRDRTVKIWNTNTWENTLTLRGHTGSVQSLAWSSDDLRLATGGLDQSVRVWDTAHGHETLMLRGHTTPLTSVAWGPDGILFTASEDRNLLYDAAIGHAVEQERDLRQALIEGIRTGEWPTAAVNAERFLALRNQQRRRWIESEWWISGPYPGRLVEACAPESEPDSARPAPTSTASIAATPHLPWQPLPDAGAMVDLGKSLAGAPRISAYARRYVYSPVRRDVALLLGADDTVRVWLNGKLVHEELAARSLNPDEDAVPATLERGWNTVLVKVANVTGKHGFHLRLSDDAVDVARAVLEQEIRSALQRRQWDEAERRLTDSWGRPNRWSVYLTARFLADFRRLLGSRGDLPSAEQAFANYTQSIASGQAGPLVYLARGNVSHQLKRWTETASDYSTVLTLLEQYALANGNQPTGNDSQSPLPPDDLSAAARFISASDPTSEQQLARDKRRDLLSSVANQVEALERRGEAYLELRQWEKSLADWDRLLALKPDDLRYLDLRGRCLNGLERWETALTNWTRLIERDPRAYRYWHGRATVHRGLGQHDQALADFDQALEHASTVNDRWWCHYNRGRHLAAMGEWERAAADFSQYHTGIVAESLEFYHWRDVSVGLMAAGKGKELTPATSQLLKRLPASIAASDVSWAVNIAVLTPEFVTQGNAADLLALANQADARNRPLLIAALDLRLGRWQESVAAFDAHRGSIHFNFLAAMANHRRGLTEQAQRWLTQGRAEMERLRARAPGQSVPISSWQEWGMVLAAEREASAVLTAE